MTSRSTSPRTNVDDRWRFLRDVLVFQVKLFLDNVRDFALVPISLGAALIDLVFKGEREGALFYKVLRWGSHSEEVIDVYSAIEHHERGDFKMNPEYTVDAVIARLEGVLMREYEKGGTAASIKAAMDRTIDQLHRETSNTGDRARDVMVRAADKLRSKFDSRNQRNSKNLEGRRMSGIERGLLERLDKILQSEGVRAQIAPIVERVRGDLHQKPTAVMAWEPIPLTTYGDALPAEIRSSWVFILRAGANTGAERHPNSHQRMMSFDATGDLQVEEQRSEVGGQKSDFAVRWQANILVSEPEASVERRWISIPPNVWHQPVVPNEADWVVVSFHTVPADELIEERPEPGGAGTKQRLYLAKAETRIRLC